MNRSIRLLGFVSALILAAPLPLAAQDVQAPEGRISRLSVHTGEMSVDMPSSMASMLPERLDFDDVRRRETLRFEPYEMLQEMFRSDLVFVMRHGPTDWSVGDAFDVAPTDCANQRVLSPEGTDRMKDLGVLLAGNGLRPARILVSEWCRGQETLKALLSGMADVDAEYAAGIEVETEPALDLLLSLQGAPDTERMEEIVADWDGGDGSGPLLLITHFTNIDEMTNFAVFEGEMLMVDPKRDSRVLGYLRLRSAAADVGHFK